MSDENSVDSDHRDGRLDHTDLDIVLRHGVDVVSIERIASLLSEFGDSFEGRVFTDAERDYCEAQARPAQHYAARWAAKEAFLKTLGEPSPSLSLTSVEVVREPTGPSLSLDEAATSALDEALAESGRDVSTVTVAVSLSHDRATDAAVASVVVGGGDGE
jgi:holo-[acyl-carrier protein] synthase